MKPKLLHRSDLLGRPLLAALLCLAPVATPAATHTVTVLSDSGGGSLRNIIAAAAPADTIQFANGLTGTITLTSGELAIAKNLTITGPGPASLTLSGNGTHRVFNITAGTVSLSGLTVADGEELMFGGGLRVVTPAEVTMTDCIVTGNSADDGGGIYTSGKLVLNRCLFTANVAEGEGAAIVNYSELAVTNCTFAGNGFAPGTTILWGGAIMNLGNLHLANCTLSGNSALRGGGIYTFPPVSAVRNTLIAGNTATQSSPDVYGPAVSLGYNLVGITNGSSGWVPADLAGSVIVPLDPLLGPLQNHGGPTPTMAPLPGSLAIDAGASGSPAIDQRGQPRPYDQPAFLNPGGGDGTDIGAYEAGAGESPTLVVLNNNDSGAGSLRQALADAPLLDLYAITFDPSVTGTITLTTDELMLRHSLAIIGPGANILTVSGNNARRIFNVTNGTVQISGLTIANGATPSVGGGVRNISPARLWLRDCAISNNSADAGGGLYNNGVATLDRCVIAANTSDSDGGGAVNYSTFMARNCTFFGNGPAPANTILYGGGIVNFGGACTLTHCTIAGNTALRGGGIYSSPPLAAILNTIVAGNTASQLGPDVYGPVVSQGYNLIGKTNNSSGWLASDQTGKIVAPLDPLLGPFQDNGGPTPTLAPSLSSPALDPGKSSGLSTDQRGEPRPYDLALISDAAGGNASDIGAFEYIAPLLNLILDLDKFVLLWSANNPGFTLEYTTNLVRPDWLELPVRPVIVNGHYAVTNTFTGAQRYYRLKH